MLQRVFKIGGVAEANTTRGNLNPGEHTIMNCPDLHIRRLCGLWSKEEVERYRVQRPITSMSKMAAAVQQCSSAAVQQCIPVKRGGGGRSS